MYTVEFEATVQNGLIEIPAELRSTVSDQVRVILLVEEGQTKRKNWIEYLMDHPLHLADPEPLTREEIYAR